MVTKNHHPDACNAEHDETCHPNHGCNGTEGKCPEGLSCLHTRTFEEWRQWREDQLRVLRYMVPYFTHGLTSHQTALFLDERVEGYARPSSELYALAILKALEEQGHLFSRLVYEGPHARTEQFWYPVRKPSEVFGILG